MLDRQEAIQCQFRLKVKAEIKIYIFYKKPCKSNTKSAHYYTA